MSINPFQGDVSSAPRRLSVMTGDREILTELRRKISKYEVPASVWFDHALRWPRDCRVVLPDQKHLIPAFLPRLEDKIFYALLPSPMFHFITERQQYAGCGMLEGYQERAKTLASQMKIPYEQGLSCIEGGNCQIFKGVDGKAKAIIGYSSLILTVLSFLKEDFLAKYQSDLDQYVAEHPVLSSPDSLRLARNFTSVLHRVDHQPEKELAEAEAAIWMDGARKIEALFALAKQTISKELGIPLERIAFVFHERFHIDMELFVGPNDCVFLHDEALMVELRQKMPASFSFLKNTYQYSESHLALNQRMLDENTRILEQIGCKAIRVPGVLTAEFEEGSISYSHLIDEWVGEKVLFSKEDQKIQDEETPRFVDLLNFMNGLFFSEPSPRWIVAGAPKGHAITNLIKKAFKEVLSSHCPELRTSLMRMTHLSKRLIMGSGGLRCLTSPV